MENEGVEVIYRDGYLIPVEPIRGQFDIEKDKALIDKGSHFFCQGHLAAVVIEQQSRDPKYCFDCYKVIRE